MLYDSTDHYVQTEYWPHAPLHLLSTSGTYFVTAATYQKVHHFIDPQRLDVLQRGLLSLAKQYNWQLEAWCILSNHYHFVAQSPPNGANTLKSMLSLLHSKMAVWINKLDNAPQRMVWDNFRETKLTFHKSYLARLHYTHANAVHHGLVKKPNDYPWCSAKWFEQVADKSMVQTIYSMPIGKLNIQDDY